MERSSNFKKYEKVIIFGDDQVGKTSIIKRLSGNQLEFKYEKIKGKLIHFESIKIDFLKKTFIVKSTEKTFRN